MTAPGAFSRPPAGPTRRDRRLLRLSGVAVPSLLRFVSEGAWIAVVYSCARSVQREPGPLEPAEFAVAAAIGWLLAGAGARRAAGSANTVLGVIVTCGAVAWLASAMLRRALAEPVPLIDVAASPDLWLLGLALLRGVSDARAPADEPPGGSLLTGGTFAIAAAFLVGGGLSDPWKSAFRAAAVPDTIIFVAAGLVGLSLLRIRELDAPSGLDWQGNWAWVGVLLALVVAMLLVAGPASLVIGPAVLVLLSLLPPVLVVAGLFAGIDRRSLRILLLAVALGAVAVFVARFLNRVQGNQQAQAGPTASAATAPDTWLIVGIWLVVMVVVAALIAVLLAIWARQALRSSGDTLGEERTIDRTGSDRRELARFAFRRRARRGAPRDAVEAYLAAVDLLAAYPGLRRMPRETPAEHARRVRVAVEGPPAGPAPRGPTSPAASATSGPAKDAPGPRPALHLQLARLAADYELARFGGRDLTDRETRRALARWASIRTGLGRLARLAGRTE